MPLPLKAKTWEFDVNQAYPILGTSLQTHQAVLLGIKNSLTNVLASRGAVVQDWVVKQSSTSLAKGEGDLWLDDPTKLVWGASAHSWIVLGQAGVSANFEICIDLKGSDPTKLTIVWAPTGFPLAGDGAGTTSERPTADPEVVLLDDGEWLGGHTDMGFKVHVMQSTDGKCTRVVGYWQNTPVLFWLFDQPVRTVSNWTLPAIALATGTSGGNVTYDALHTVSSPKLWGIEDDEPFALWMSTESFGSSLGAVGAKLLTANSFDSNWPITPIGLASVGSPNPGRHGEIADLWFGSDGVNDGDTYPGDMSRRFVQFGHLVFPWDGTAEEPGSTPEIG